MKLSTLVLACALATTLSGCGGAGEKDSVGQQPSPTPSSTVAGSACPSGTTTSDLKTKPNAVQAPRPTKTEFTDVVVGTGKEATVGSEVEVKYVGVLLDTCKEFDSSWSRGVTETLPFAIGEGVIPGFSIGTTGMKVGGRRQVVIPAADGYGPEGSGPIPPDATLIFLIDLVKVG